MSSTQLSLHHIVQEPRTVRGGAPPLLLLLHGIGSDERDLIGLAPSLDERFFIVSARAPIALGLQSFAWYHAEFVPEGSIINAEEAEDSRKLLLGFIGELVEKYSLDSRRVYLMGFSQGAIMSLALGLSEPNQVAGIVAMSGRLLDEALPLLAPAESLAGLPILVVHGTEDPVLPVQFGRAIQRRLDSLPVALTYREYPIGHQVSKESLSDVAEWLREQLDGGGRTASG